MDVLKEGAFFTGRHGFIKLWVVRLNIKPTINNLKQN